MAVLVKRTHQPRTASGEEAACPPQRERTWYRSYKAVLYLYYISYVVATKQHRTIMPHRATLILYVHAMPHCVKQKILYFHAIQGRGWWGYVDRRVERFNNGHVELERGLPISS